ncbi:hypothetical protein IFM89_028578 [Coptis chinensis]|uniref:Pectinesterase n=1 Tax=Coptis chinensis TaxID=261450 RepID=A0A835IGH7_9MAGN|nr:hypothetical protein IFM89_028578 [Coptis chinensis]
MIGKVTHKAVQATFLTTIFFLIFYIAISAEDPTSTPNAGTTTLQVNVPAAGNQTCSAELDALLMTELRDTSGIDPALSAAERAPKIIRVRKDGSGEFKSVTDALKSIPAGNTVRTIISIGPGTYNEKIRVDRNKPFVTFMGTDPNSKPILAYSSMAAQSGGTWNSAATAVESEYFMAANIVFQNTAPKPTGKKNDGEQAVAMRISGDKAAFYNCRFISFQDTLCDDVGNHFFENCYVEGTVDFVFGTGKSLYLYTALHSVGDGFGAVTASGRGVKDDDSAGFTFVHCKITGSGNLYLGRTWKNQAKIVFAYTEMDGHINPAGWINDKPGLREDTMFYGEYKCSGPGSSTGKRATYAKLLTDAEAKPFLDKSYIKVEYPMGAMEAVD